MMLTTVIIFCPYPVTAQPKPFTVYTSEDGLLTNQIFDFKRDHEGFVWIATGEGINIYDGTRFQALIPEKEEISAAPAWSLFEPQPGEMWVGTSKGVDVFKNRKRVFTFHKDTSASFLRLKNGVTLAMDIRGVSILKDFVFHLEFPSDKNLTYLAELNNCILVMPSEIDSLFILDLQCHVISRIRFSGGFIKDGNGHLWYLIDGKVMPADMDALEKGQIKFLPIPKSLDKHNHDIADFYLDKDGYYWLSKYSKGITVIDKEGLAKQYTMNDGLPSNEIAAFREDNEGNTWTLNGALIRFGFKNVHLFTSLNGMQLTNCWSIAEHKASGSLWFLQSDGITSLYKGKFSFFPFPNGKTGIWRTILIYGDSLLINHPGMGYYRISFANEPKLQFIKGLTLQIPGSNEVFEHYQCIQDIDGSLWMIAMNAGKYQLNRLDKSGKNQVINQVGGQVRLLMDDDKLWVGSWGTPVGIWLYKITRLQDSVSLQLIKEFDKLPDNSIRSFCKDKYGNVWAGTRSSGLIRFVPQPGGEYIMDHFTKRDGLKGNWIRSIRQIKSGLLVATDHGINLLQLSNRGVTINDVLEKSSLADASWDVLQTEKGGLIWVATENGALRIDNKQQLTSHSPPVFITHATSNNITLEIDSLNNTSILPPHRDNIYFEFSSTLLSYEKNILYSYRLIQHGDSIEWSPPSPQTSVTYASLSPGNYVFEVKALVNNSTWSRAPAIWTFTILKPVWQRWWFYSLVTLIVLLTAYFFVREIIYRKLEKQRLALEKQNAIDTERLRISSELHDDLGGGLSTIRLMSELIQHGDKNGESKKQLEKISSNSKELVQKMNEIVWALNIKNDTLAGLLSYIRQYAALFLDDNMLDCKLTITDQVPDLAITGSKRRDIFLLVKESLNNVVKHAHASKVDISFTIDDLLQIKIHDDGIGFNTTNRTTTSNGLRNMGKRVDELMGTMTIKNHEGTTLIFDIPLKNLSHESVQ
jgi:signal transduction histidine kinase/ligand-binding sensor domain-containing protein